MTRYSVQPRDWIFVKGYEFLSFVQDMGTNIGINISKNLVVKTAKNLLIILKSLLQMHLKLLQKDQFRKEQKQLVILFVIKLQIKLQKSRKLHHRIIQN